MTTREEIKVEITCDLCGKYIAPDLTYVNAHTYGADFHKHCIDEHKAVIKALRLDDIKIMNSYNEWETARKYIYES